MLTIPISRQVYELSLIEYECQLLADKLWERDRDTYWHCQRVADYVRTMLRFIPCISPQDKYLIFLGMKIHDIGKLDSSFSPFLTGGEKDFASRERLDSADKRILISHTLNGFRMLSSLLKSSIIGSCVQDHHERWDRSGYPLGLKGDEITAAGLIGGIWDCMDAMIERNGFSLQKAKAEILAKMGTWYDPRLQDAFWQHARLLKFLNKC